MEGITMKAPTKSPPPRRIDKMVVDKDFDDEETLYLPFIDTTQGHDGCRELWCAVITQAFKDATGSGVYRFERDIARQWLLGLYGEADFTEVCDAAGLAPACVSDYAKKLYNPTEDQ